MPMAEPEDFKLIREIVANGGHKHTSAPEAIRRVVDLGLKAKR